MRSDSNIVKPGFRRIVSADFLIDPGPFFCFREQFKAKLSERLRNPRVPAAKLSGHSDRYKIKLRSAGYRLVYEVRDRLLIVIVVAVGKRERNAVYKAAAKR